MLYPNEESAVWDVNGMFTVTLTTPIIGASPVSSGYRRISNNSYKIQYVNGVFCYRDNYHWYNYELLCGLWMVHLVASCFGSLKDVYYLKFVKAHTP